MRPAFFPPHKSRESFFQILLLTVVGVSCILSPAAPLLAQTPLNVTVRGLKDPLLENVLNFLDIEKQKNNKELTPHWIQNLHQQSSKEIREALQPYGYYQPEIIADLQEKDGTWMATYIVNKGLPVKITKRDVRWIGEGATDPVFQESIKSYFKNCSNRLIHSEYETAKNNFMSVAFSNGYPKARFIKSEWLVDLASNSAELTLHMDTGPLYYFGDVFFQQNFLDPKLLARYNSIKKGSPYSHEDLLTFQQILIASNYAREINIEPLFHKAENKLLPVNILMEPIVPHRFTFGLGYETDIGLRGSARWDDRLINRYGHHSEVLIKLSGKETTLRGQYSIPVVKQITDNWVSSTSYNYEETPDTSSSTFDLETSFVRRNFKDTQFYKAFILAASEAFTVGNNPKTTTNLLIPGGTIRFSTMEEEAFPQKGCYFFTDLRGAVETLLSDTSFARLHVKGQYMMGLGESGRIDTRMEVGVAWVNDFSFYPASLRFFAGGDNSVRGYRYESLGPGDDKGVVVGGKQVFSGSLQYDHRVAESWVVDGFVDLGNAYNGTLDKVYVGAGAGFRWLAPFGSLRFDIAYPVSEQPQLDDWRIHIGFGATL